MASTAPTEALSRDVWLVLDAGGLSTQVGLWEEAHWRAYFEATAPALETLFAGVKTALAQARVEWPQITGFIYVEGPGSVLGLRLAAMAIRTWQADDRASLPARAPRPVFSCGSLHLAAALVLAAGTKPPFAICTEARQKSWNVLEVERLEPSALSTVTGRVVAEDGLPGGELFYAPARKSWAGPPPHAKSLPASLRDHPEVLSFPGLCRPTETATPYGIMPVYRKWESATKVS